MSNQISAKEQFLKNLGIELRGLPEEEQKDALDYYEEYFADSPLLEEELISKLESPAKVAKSIMAESNIQKVEDMKTSAKKGFSALRTVILSILAAPIGLPLAIIVVSVILALLISIGGVILSLMVAAIALILAGVVCILFAVATFMVHALSGVAVLGMGMVILGVGALLFMGTAALGKLFINGMLAISRKITRRGKNEIKE